MIIFSTNPRPPSPPLLLSQYAAQIIQKTKGKGASKKTSATVNGKAGKNKQTNQIGKRKNKFQAGKQVNGNKKKTTNNSLANFRITVLNE